MKGAGEQPSFWRLCILTCTVPWGPHVSVVQSILWPSLTISWGTCSLWIEVQKWVCWEVQGVQGVCRDEIGVVEFQGIQTVFWHHRAFLNDSLNLCKALWSKNVSKWEATIQEEYDLLVANDTWELTNILKDCKSVGCKWVFHTNLHVLDEIARHKVS